MYPCAITPHTDRYCIDTVDRESHYSTVFASQLRLVHLLAGNLEVALVAATYISVGKQVE
jgi:hypothetical protein